MWQFSSKVVKKSWCFSSQIRLEAFLSVANAEHISEGHKSHSRSTTPGLGVILFHSSSLCRYPPPFPDSRTWPHSHETLRSITAITVRFRFPLLVLIPPEQYLLWATAEAPSQASLWDMKLVAVGIKSDIVNVWRLAAVCLFDLSWRSAQGCTVPQSSSLTGKFLNSLNICF